MSEASRPAIEYETFQVETGGQDVRVTWFPPHDVPEGQRHGSGGICLTDNGEVVLATHDGETWDSRQADRKEVSRGKKTLRREMREEACVEVREAKLLGVLARESVSGGTKRSGAGSLHLAGRKSSSTSGHPEHETLARKLVQPEGVLGELALDVFLPLHHRALITAGLLKE